MIILNIPSNISPPLHNIKLEVFNNRKQSYPNEPNPTSRLKACTFANNTRCTCEMVCKAREQTVQYCVIRALHLVPGASFNGVYICDNQNNNKIPPFNIIDEYNVWRHAQYHRNSWMRTLSWVYRYSQDMLRSIVHGVKRFNFIRGSPRGSSIAVRHNCIIFFELI